MKCPYCEKEMLQGLLSGDGRSGVYWKEGDKKPTVFEKMGGSFRVTAVKYSLPSFSIEAYYCPDCKKMIFDTDITK